SSVLDISQVTDKGVLLPNVALTGTTDTGQIPDLDASGYPDGLLIYNTATAGVPPNDVTPGYYYWDGTAWLRFVNQDDFTNLETLTVFSLNADGQNLDYTDENGLTTQVDLAPIIDNFETVTDISLNGATGILTYNDEDGNSTNIDLAALIAAQETLTALTVNVGNNTLDYTDETPTLNQLDISPLVESTAWSLSGNPGSGHFLGTTDANEPLLIRVGGAAAANDRLRITAAGQIEVLNTAQSVFLGEGAGINTNFGANRDNVFVGHLAGTTITTGANNVGIGFGALQNSTASDNVAIGSTALQTNTLGVNNVAIGARALTGITSGNNNIAIGKNALESVDASSVTYDSNIAIGSATLQNNLTGFRNIAIGTNALLNNVNGRDNIAIGNGALIKLTQSISNTVVGVIAGQEITSGSNNVIYGYSSGTNITTGDGNIVLGYDADVPSTTADNQLSIGNLIYGTGLDGRGGGISGGNIGIGLNNPSAKLHVNGSLRQSTNWAYLGGFNAGGVLPNGDTPIAGVGQPGHLAIGWNYSTGSREMSLWNTHVPPAPNGNEKAFVFHQFGVPTTQLMTIEANGNVGLGVTDPSNTLDVSGTVRLAVPGTGTPNYVLATTDGSGVATWVNPNTIVTGDNLGNHTATQNIAMSNFNISNAGTVSTGTLQVSGGSPSAGLVLTATDGTGVASWVDPSTLVAGDNLGNHIATQNVQMANFSVLNATNVEANVLLDPDDTVITINDNVSVRATNQGVPSLDVIDVSGNAEAPNIRLTKTDVIGGLTVYGEQGMSGASGDFSNLATPGDFVIRNFTTSGTGGYTGNLIITTQSGSRNLQPGGDIVLLTGVSGSRTGDTERMRIRSDGWVGIGNVPGNFGSELLRVGGSIRTATQTVADYVFDKYYEGKSAIKDDYEFKTLEEVEAFIKEQGHLPGIESYEEVKANDMTIDLSQTTMSQLEKIEELFLYAIELNKRQKSLKAENRALKPELANMDKTTEANASRIDKLEAFIKSMQPLKVPGETVKTGKE
uniref:beta strand repeat-containing protein n=1 Tax=Leptobacterium meishanense TaxID=3128904 RepID=UPI0039B78333